jgi:hypothetical protein
MSIVAGTTRPLQRSDFYKAGAMTGFVAAFTEGPIDFYKSQLQVQIIRSKQDPAYKREWGFELNLWHSTWGPSIHHHECGCGCDLI